MKILAHKFFSIFGLGITSYGNLKQLKAERLELYKLRRILKLLERVKTHGFSVETVFKAIDEIDNSKGQLNQDLIALMITNFKRGGYFVEFGATDGVGLSNTYILEKSFGWNGILAEPARNWHGRLGVNRGVKIETRCVWSKSGEVLKFNETKYGELSTIDSFSSSDLHSHYRVSGTKYEVETISLQDLLDENGSPKFIDYISIDTEGSEYEILRNFDFSKYSFKFITCEHNFNENREDIYNLLTSNGYIRILESASDFDDWYIHNSLMKAE
jgi:FkbM family methyltransferase